MTCNHILQSVLVFSLQIELLEEKNPSDEAGLRIGLLHEVLQSELASENDDLGINQVRLKLFQGKNNC